MIPFGLQNQWRSVLPISVPFILRFTNSSYSIFLKVKYNNYSHLISTNTPCNGQMLWDFTFLNLILFNIYHGDNFIFVHIYLSLSLSLFKVACSAIVWCTTWIVSSILLLQITTQWIASCLHHPCRNAEMHNIYLYTFYSCSLCVYTHTVTHTWFF